MPNPLMTHTSEDMARLCETHGDMGPDQLDDEADTGNDRGGVDPNPVCSLMFSVSHGNTQRHKNQMDPWSF